MSENPASRADFFDAVYRNAQGNPVAVPWADLKPKDELVQWLARNPGNGRRAIDIACGLGDNAEAIAAAGWNTTAFDLAPDAISWAKKRFPHSGVDYLAADLVDPPAGWNGSFDLVNECYTLQAVPPAIMPRLRQAICDLVAPGGRLLVYARVRADGAEASGPPWPLETSEAMSFAGMGFELVAERRFALHKGERRIEHLFCDWRRRA